MLAAGSAIGSHYVSNDYCVSKPSALLEVFNVLGEEVEGDFGKGFLLEYRHNPSDLATLLT